MTGIETINSRYEIPFLEHEKAIDSLIEKLKEEFPNSEIKRISGKTRLKEFGIEWTGACPDLIICHPDRQMLIVEVGSTEAEKITFYLSRQSVNEIRWYDRYLNLVGQWSKDGQGDFTNITFDESLKHLIKVKDEGIEKLSDRIANLKKEVEMCQKRNENQNKKIKELKSKLFDLSPQGEAKRETEYSMARRKETAFRKQLFDEHIGRFNKEMLEVLFILFNQRPESVYFFCPSCFSKVPFWNASLISNSNGQNDILVCHNCKYVPSISELKEKLAKVNEWHNNSLKSVPEVSERLKEAVHKLDTLFRPLEQEKQIENQQGGGNGKHPSS